MIPLAHAQLIGRRDLPIPEWLFAWAAVVVLLVSFVALSLLWKRAYFETDAWRPVSRQISRLIVNPLTEVLAGMTGVLLLAVVVWSGLSGTELNDRNFAPTFVFITYWLGLVLLSVLFGDVFRAFSPWRAIGRVYGGGFRLVAGESWQAPLRLPEWLGRWPAAVGVVTFAWFELIWAGGGSQGGGLTPHDVSVAALVYTAYALGGMALFGIDTWLARGEAFSVYFGMFSHLAPLEVRSGRLGVRRALAGLARWATGPGSLPVVVTAIGITAFDGAQEGALRGAINTLYDGFRDLGLSYAGSYRLSATLFLIASIAAIAVIYWIGVVGMRSVRGSPGAAELGWRFAHTLVPIALAYLVAHYFSYFVFGEQAQFTYLLSDPLGNGSNYFGTVTGGIDYGALGASAIWYVQVAALVLGHVTGLTLAHDRAITIYGDPDRASRSQRWMLFVMVCFTCLGLFLLSQSNR